MRVVVGKSYRFEYPWYGEPDEHPEITAHSGQVVKVIRKLGRDEADVSYAIYEGEAADGARFTIVCDELFSASKRMLAMVAALKAAGWTVGQRDEHGFTLNRKYAGKYIAVEPHEKSETPTDDGSNGPWCIVGDDADKLVREAYEFVRGSAA